MLNVIYVVFGSVNVDVSAGQSKDVTYLYFFPN